MLERKPGTLAGSTPLAQWREQERWPASYDQLWQALMLMRRQGKAEGTRQMIRLLQLGKAQGDAKLAVCRGVRPAGWRFCKVSYWKSRKIEKQILRYQFKFSCPRPPEGEGGPGKQRFLPGRVRGWCGCGTLRRH